MEEKKRKRKKIIMILSIILASCSPFILCAGCCMYGTFIEPIIFKVDSEGIEELKEKRGITLPEDYEFIEGYVDNRIYGDCYELHIVVKKDDFRDMFGPEWYTEGDNDRTIDINFMGEGVIVCSERYKNEKNFYDDVYYRIEGEKVHVYFQLHGSFKHIK